MELNTNNERSMLGETLALAGLGLLGGIISAGICALVEEGRVKGRARFNDQVRLGIIDNELDAEEHIKAAKKAAKKKPVKKVVTKQIVAKKVATRKTTKKK